MKTKLIVAILFLAVVAHAHDTGPESMVHTIISMSEFYVSGSKDITLSVVDYEALQKLDPSMSKDKFYATLKSVDSEDIVLIQVEDPPYSTVVEMTNPKRIRFYFKKQKSNHPSPHDPKYHEEWDYILIGLKIMESNQGMEPTRDNAQSIVP